MITTGSRAPLDLTFTTSAGSSVTLGELLKGRTLVLYFYPKDETPGCTAEACAFRDSYEDFTAAGADVVGVSADGEASHEAFKSRHRLPFTLLTDPRGQAASALGVKKTFGLIPGRVTFVIDREGVVRHRFESQVRVEKHVREALALVRSLEGQPAAATA